MSINPQHIRVIAGRVKNDVEIVKFLDSLGLRPKTKSILLGYGHVPDDRNIFRPDARNTFRLDHMMPEELARAVFNDLFKCVKKGFGDPLPDDAGYSYRWDVYRKGTMHLMIIEQVAPGIAKVIFHVTGEGA